MTNSCFLRAPVAQGIESQTSNLLVGGSNPPGRASETMDPPNAQHSALLLSKSLALFDGFYKGYSCSYQYERSDYQHNNRVDVEEQYFQ